MTCSANSPWWRKAVAKADTIAADSTHLSDLDDLCNMNSLHEAPLLDMLRRRYANDVIYTYIANLIISINPYKQISGLYEDVGAYVLACVQSQQCSVLDGEALRCSAAAHARASKETRCALGRGVAHNSAGLHTEHYKGKP